MPWADVEADPKYAALSDSDKTRAKTTYFETRIAKDPKYDALSDSDKKRARDTFLTKPAAAPVTTEDKQRASGAKIEGTSDVGITPLSASETYHDVLHAASDKIKDIAKPSPNDSMIGRGIKAVDRAGAGLFDAAQGFEIMGPQDIMTNLALQPVAQVAGNIAGKIASPAMKAVQEHLTPKDLSPEMRKAIKDAQDMGITLSPGQLTQSKTLLKIEAALRNIPLVADVMGDFDRKQAKQLGDARQKILDAMPALKTSAEAGEASKPILEKRIAEIDDAHVQALKAAQEDLAKRTENSAKFQAGATARLAERQTLLESQEANKYVKQRNALSPGGSKIPQNVEERGAGSRAAIDDLESKFLKVRSALYGKAKAAAGDLSSEVELPTLLSASEKVKASYPDTGARTLRGKGFSVASDYTKVHDPVPMPKLTPGLDPATMSEKQLSTLPPAIQAQIKAAKAPPTPTMTVEQLQGEIKRLGDAAQNARYESGTSSDDALHLTAMKKAAEADLDAHFAKTSSQDAKRLYATAKAFHGNYSDRFRNDTIAKMYKASPTKTFTDIMGAKDYESAKILVNAMGQDGRKIAKRQLFDNIFGSQAGLPDVKTVMSKVSDYGPAMRAILTKEEQEQWRNFAMTGFSAKISNPLAPQAAHVLKEPVFIKDAYEDAVRGLIKNSPQKLTEELIPPSGGNVLVAKAAKKYLPPSVFDVHGRQLAENILTGSTEVEGGLKGIQSRFSRYDPDYLNEFFGKKTVEGMSQLGSASQLLPGTADLSAKAVGATIGAMYVTGMVLRPTIAFRGVASATLISLPTLTRAYLSPEGRQYLTTFLRMAPDDPRGPALIAKFAAKFAAPKVSAALTNSRDKNDGLLQGRK